MYGGEKSGMPLGADPVNNGTGTFGADDNYDQPAAIVSGGEDGGAVAFDSSNKSNNNSAKFFGRRSRESATRADAAQTQANAELAAASSIANNPNNPDFFRQAAAENATSQIQRQPRQINKKPFIIGGIVLVAIVFVVLAISLVPKLFQGINDKKIADLKIDASEYYEDIEFYDGVIKASREGAMDLFGLIIRNEEDYKLTIDALDAHLSRSKELQKKLDDAKKIGTNDEEFDKLVSDASDALNKRISIYEQYGVALKSVTEALYVNNTKSAKELLGGYNSASMTRVADLIDNYWSRSRSIEKQQEQNGCSSRQSSVCESLKMDLDSINQQFAREKVINSALQDMVSDKEYYKDRILIQLREISEYNKEAEDEKENK